MKPQSIKLFDYFYLGSIFLGVLAFITGLGGLEAELAAQAAQSGVEISTGLVIVGYAIGVLIGLALWYFVSQRRSNIAKWLVLILFLLQLIGVGDFFAGPMSLSTIYSIASLIALAVAVGLLFRADATRWLAGKPGAGADAETPAARPTDDA